MKVSLLSLIHISRVEEGTPAETIVRVADEENADLIVASVGEHDDQIRVCLLYTLDVYKRQVESAAARRKELKDGPLPQPLKASLGIKTCLLYTSRCV